MVTGAPVCALGPTPGLGEHEQAHEAILAALMEPGPGPEETRCRWTCSTGRGEAVRTAPVRAGVGERRCRGKTGAPSVATRIAYRLCCLRGERRGG